MDDLLAQIREHARRHSLFEVGETVIVGVSGGPDSVCLLHVLTRLAPELSLRLHVAHLNHGLRGVDAEADARYVQVTAANWGLPFAAGAGDVLALARAGGLSVEEAARQARYAFLGQVAYSVGARTVAVGHHADDQAETVLMHFLRGSGVSGLRGMLPRSRLADYRTLASRLPAEREAGRLTAEEAENAESRDVDRPRGGRDVLLAGPCSEESMRRPGEPMVPADVWLVRPLLPLKRSEVMAYCREHHLQPRFDLSNEDTTFFRNRLRHELLPVLERYSPSIRRLLTHTAEVMAADYEVLHAETEAALRSLLLLGPEGEWRLKLDAWRTLPLGLQRSTVREIVHHLRRSLRDLGWEHVDRAVQLARQGNTGQKATLVAGLELEIGYGELRIAPEGSPWEAEGPQVDRAIRLAAPGTTQLPGGWRVEVTCLRSGQVRAEVVRRLAPWTAWLDAGVVGETLVLRPREPGDRFQPQGLGGHSAALNEFMINAKAPRAARAGWPVLVGRSGIAWVCGLRVDERAAVRDDTETVWQVRFER